MCQYTLALRNAVCCLQARYNPTRPEILVGLGRAVNKHLFEGLASEGQKHNITFSRVRDLYAKYDYADLAQHRAVVLIPYQVCFKAHKMLCEPAASSKPLQADLAGNRPRSVYSI